MSFNKENYLTEMKSMVDQAIERLKTERPQFVIYTVSIWTDPNAAASAISFDSQHHSALEVFESPTNLTENSMMHLLQKEIWTKLNYLNRKHGYTETVILPILNLEISGKPNILTSLSTGNIKKVADAGRSSNLV